MGAFSEFSPDQKLQLIAELWDDLSANPDDVPVHDWQKAELARRKAALAADPGSAVTWEEVKERVLSRYAR